MESVTKFYLRIVDQIDEMNRLRTFHPSVKNVNYYNIYLRVDLVFKKF